MKKQDLTKLIITIIIFSIILFFIIYLAFTIDIGLYVGNNLKKTDWLNFWGSYLGSLFGAIVTIIGIYLTNKHNQETTEKTIKNNNFLHEEDKRLQILPILSLKELKLKIRDIDLIDNFKNSNENKGQDNKYIFEQNNEDNYFYCFLIKNPKLTKFLSKSESEIIKENLKTPTVIDKSNILRNIKSQGNLYHIKKPNDIFSPIRISNVGKSAAINLNIEIINLSNNHKANSTILNVLSGEYFNLGIFSKNKNFNKYKVIFTYSDIFGHEYEQSHQIRVIDNDIFITLEINQIYKNVIS